MVKLMKMAAKAWVRSTLNVKKFADAYITAVSRYGDDARQKFAQAYLIFGPREWERLEMIGNGVLLPQFMFKSDSFVKKLLRMNSSIELQRALVSADKKGEIRIDRGNGPEKVRLEDLKGNEEKALSFLLSESDEKINASELKYKFKSLVIKINKQNQSCVKPTWEIREKNGRVLVHFNRACSFEKDDLKKILSLMNKDKSSVRKQGNSSSYLLKKLCDAAIDLESLRDDELCFYGDYGHDALLWNEKEEKEHDEIIVRIIKSQRLLREIIRMATGKKIGV